MVEEKAKRVDELESKMVLLEMDKDKLKFEVNRMTDQLVGQLDSGLQDNGGKTKNNLHVMGLNSLAMSSRMRNATTHGKNNRISAPLGGLIGLQQNKKNATAPPSKFDAKLDPNRRRKQM